MQQAFELTGLLAEMKKNGLELAEESAKVAVKSVFNWLEDSVKLTANPFDDFFLVARPQIEALVMEAAEKINPAD